MIFVQMLEIVALCDMASVLCARKSLLLKIWDWPLPFLCFFVWPQPRDLSIVHLLCFYLIGPPTRDLSIACLFISCLFELIFVLNEIYWIGAKITSCGILCFKLKKIKPKHKFPGSLRLLEILSFKISKPKGTVILRIEPSIKWELIKIF